MISGRSWQAIIIRRRAENSLHVYVARAIRRQQNEENSGLWPSKKFSLRYSSVYQLAFGVFHRSRTYKNGARYAEIGSQIDLWPVDNGLVERPNWIFTTLTFKYVLCNESIVCPHQTLMPYPHFVSCSWCFEARSSKNACTTYYIICIIID